AAATRRGASRPTSRSCRSCWQKPRHHLTRVAERKGLVIARHMTHKGANKLLHFHSLGVRLVVEGGRCVVERQVVSKLISEHGGFKVCPAQSLSAKGLPYACSSL